MCILFNTDNLDERVFDLEMIPTCTRLKVLILGPYTDNSNINFSSQSFVNALNRLISLQTLSLTAVKLLDMVSHT